MAKLKVQSFAKVPNKFVSIERSRGLSLLEEKLVYMLINSMQKRYESTKKLASVDFDFIATGIISFDDFQKTMQIGSVNRKEIGEALQNLILFAIAIKTATKDKFMTMFKEFSADYESNTIEYKFNDCFVQYFTGVCRDYFQLSVNEVIALNSTHAIRIYQILKTRLNMIEQAQREPVFIINELKKLLNIETKYPRYNNLKTRVLEVVKQEINSSEASAFDINYGEIKTGKAVTSIKFLIIPRGKNYYDEKNIIAGYRIDQINKLCLTWTKEYKKHDVVYILAEKIQQEMKHKKPSQAMIRNYFDTIKTITNQQVLDL